MPFPQKYEQSVRQSDEFQESEHKHALCVPVPPYNCGGVLHHLSLIHIFARNIFLGYEKTYSRKIKEMFIAVALEQKYTKQEILEFYLNNVYFANGYYGIESASEAYFNKNAKDLSISQIAFLCSIPNSPNRYDPYKHKDSTLKDVYKRQMYS